AGDDGGDGLQLNGGRRLVALFGYGARQLGRKPEFGKRHGFWGTSVLACLARGRSAGWASPGEAGTGYGCPAGCAADSTGFRAARRASRTAKLRVFSGQCERNDGRHL